MSQWPRAAVARTSGVPPRWTVRLVMPSAAAAERSVPVVRIADSPLDQERLRRVREQPAGSGQYLDCPGVVPAVPAVRA